MSDRMLPGSSLVSSVQCPAPIAGRDFGQAIQGAAQVTFNGYLNPKMKTEFASRPSHGRLTAHSSSPVSSRNLKPLGNLM
jgi:hypothetical protein